VALQMKKNIPPAAKDAFIIVEMNCRPTLAELDCMPQSLVDTVLLYSSVKRTIEQGQEMRL